MTQRQFPVVPLLAICVLAACVALAMLWRTRRDPAPAIPVAGSSAAGRALPAAAAGVTDASELAPTTIYAHNLLLRKGPQFRIYVRWIRGQMVRTRKEVDPSFDDPDSFVLEIQKGVIRANIGDISDFLNGNMPKGAPLQKVTIEPAGDLLKLRGTVHKIVPLPVELDGRLLPTADGRVQFHVSKIDALKIPLKGLLGGFHLELSDLAGKTAVPGVQVVGNDVYFDTERLLPPPHIHGTLTAITVATPDLELIYGGARNDPATLERWHNFLRLRGGSLEFGKLTMHPVDLTMIDASQGPWFDLDLVNYQAQLVNGYTRMTPQAGLEIFMPELEEGGPKKKASQAISLEWLKNKHLSVPADVPVK